MAIVKSGRTHQTPHWLLLIALASLLSLLAGGQSRQLTGSWQPFVCVSSVRAQPVSGHSWQLDRAGRGCLSLARLGSWTLHCGAKPLGHNLQGRERLLQGHALGRYCVVRPVAGRQGKLSSRACRVPTELQGPPSEGRKALLSALLAGRLGLRPTEGRAGQEKSKVRTGLLPSCC